ncbi:hypothetical protein [Pseudonocardia sp. ICBG162]|uniref:hypothetical protein n=1 Tax=Pseudonocardia sp. ICBG162 TaxID=2846761 RepID=UPI001CF6ABF3|nr:hypothetical protein [Pseudonocardia sp. ICBG162]
MGTPPRITRDECDAVIARIHRRHSDIDDPRRSELGTEPRDVVSWVLQHGHEGGIPPDVAARDCNDALILHAWCWWDERRRERALLRRGLALAVTATELGSALGIRSRQGVRDRLDRLDALLVHDRPDEQLARASRRAQYDRGAQQRWLHDHHVQARAVLTALVAQTHRFLRGLGSAEAPAGTEPGDSDTATAAGPGDEIADWLAEIIADLAVDEITAATMALAGLLSGALRAHPAARNLDPRHRLHATLLELEALRSALARGR